MRYKNGSSFCNKCGNNIENVKVSEKDTEKHKKKLGKKQLIYIIISVLVACIIGVSIVVFLKNKPLDEKNNINENSVEDKNSSMIIFDDTTKYGATFNLTREDIDNAIKSAYKGSDCEKLVGEFGSNNSEWTKVENAINDYEMYFYISAINQQWREMGLSAFKIGLSVDNNNYIQSINFTTMGGQSNDNIISEIIKYNNVYEEFYYFILHKLFNDNNIINNMNKVQNANKVNGTSTGGVAIKDNIMYGYIIQFSEGTQMYSKQFSVGTLGDEKAKELENEYKSYNTGIYVELDNDKTENTENNQTSNQETQIENNQQDDNKKIKAVIDSYAKITTNYDGYDLQYTGYTLYARSKDGENVYLITYLARKHGMSTGLEYCRLVSLNSTNTMIDKKSEFCKLASNAGSAMGSSLVRTRYTQIWGELNSSSSSDYNYDNSSTTNNNSSNNSSSSNNTNPQKEMIQVPWFSMGYELKQYTDDLDKLGIKYKVVKGQDLNYEDNTVIKVENNGEYVEKGTTITITVADNVYNVEVQMNTEFLLGKAGFYEDNLPNEVSISIKINGTTICNSKYPATRYFEKCGTYKGKVNNLKVEAVVEGKTITLKENKDYLFSHDEYRTEITINNFDNLG